MGNRDHSETCEVCGVQRGGIMDLQCRCAPHPLYGPCDAFGYGGACSVCTDSISDVRLCHEALEYLAHNLAIAAFGCASFEMGRDAGPEPFVPFKTSWWRPGCGKPWTWPHMTRDDGRGAP